MIWMVILIALLLGLSAAGTVWFGMDLAEKLQPKMKAWRAAKAAAKAAAPTEEESGEQEEAPAPTEEPAEG